jgi:phosphoglycerate dehydrogenase-like enzyme
MPILYTKRRRLETAAEVELGARHVSLETLLRESDFVSVNVAFGAETVHLIGARELGLMRPSAFLVNTARGPVVDEKALVDALRSGTIAGAALDVFEQEPLPPESPLWGLPNVFVSPHSASTVAAENGRIVDLFRDNLARYLRGEELVNVLDKELLY